MSEDFNNQAPKPWRGNDPWERCARCLTSRPPRELEEKKRVALPVFAEGLTANGSLRISHFEVQEAKVCIEVGWCSDQAKALGFMPDEGTILEAPAATTEPEEEFDPCSDPDSALLGLPPIADDE